MSVFRCVVLRYNDINLLCRYGDGFLALFVCSACQSEMANTVAKVMTSLLLLHEERTDHQQQQYIRYVCVLIALII